MLTSKVKRGLWYWVLLCCSGGFGGLPRESGLVGAAARWFVISSIIRTVDTMWLNSRVRESYMVSVDVIAPVRRMSATRW